MIAKILIDRALSTIKHGGITIIYWNGDKKTYVADKPYATVNFTDPSVGMRLVRDTSSDFDCERNWR
jgi:hypothetical protein